MKTFPKLLKEIREESGLTQGQFANAIGVSKILVSMIETGQKEASKSFVFKLSEKLGVHPSSILPFAFTLPAQPIQKLSVLEKKLINIGSKFQNYLVKEKSKKLKNYV
jgi:transcriptional regulator with XRE-family HTH domain